MFRHCERSEVIQGRSRKSLDCFVALLLAMTNLIATRHSLLVLHARTAMVRHCERSEAIQGRLRMPLDCFVALLLAMTNLIAIRHSLFAIRYSLFATRHFATRPSLNARTARAE
jgi:hypothetical protein